MGDRKERSYALTGKLKGYSKVNEEEEGADPWGFEPQSPAPKAGSLSKLAYGPLMAADSFPVIIFLMVADYAGSG